MHGHGLSWHQVVQADRQLSGLPGEMPRSAHTTGWTTDALPVFVEADCVVLWLC